VCVRVAVSWCVFMCVSAHAPCWCDSARTTTNAPMAPTACQMPKQQHRRTWLAHMHARTNPAPSQAAHLAWMGLRCATSASVSSGLKPPQLRPATSDSTSSCGVHAHSVFVCVRVSRNALRAHRACRCCMHRRSFLARRERHPHTHTPSSCRWRAGRWSAGCWPLAGPRCPTPAWPRCPSCSA
jgi:hypothetical protein